MNRLDRGRTSTVICCLFLFGLNAWVSSDLWFARYLDHLGSAEGFFLAFGQWISRHWGRLHWFPLWFDGMPFQRVYGPNLHWTVAALSRFAHISMLRSYRLVTASMYCLGPVSLFWLCWRLTRSRAYSLAVATVCSLFSPIVLFSELVRD